MFIAALLTIAKTRKQPKCPLTEEWIKKMQCVCVYTIHLDITHNKRIMPFTATWMDLEIIIVTEVSQKETGII